EAAQAAKTPAELSAAVLNRVDMDPQAGLGDSRTHLVFFPVTPCRILDTRVAGGPLAPGGPRDFDSPGPFTAQGGSRGHCGLPTATDVAALAITLVAVDPQGAGNLRAWPKGGSVPLAVAVNYGLPGQGLSLANTTIVPLFQDLFDPLEFSLQANGSAVHVVGDVVGYFDAGNASSVVEGTNAGFVGLTSNCIEVARCEVTNPNGFARSVMVVGNAGLRVDHRVGLRDVVNVSLSPSFIPVCPGTAAGDPVPQGAGRFVIDPSSSEPV